MMHLFSGMQLFKDFLFSVDFLMLQWNMHRLRLTFGVYDKARSQSKNGKLYRHLNCTAQKITCNHFLSFSVLTHDSSLPSSQIYVIRLQIKRIMVIMWGDGYVNYLHCDSHFKMYTHIKSSHCTHQIYTVLFVNHTSIKLVKIRWCKNLKSGNCTLNPMGFFFFQIYWDVTDK